MGEWRFLRCLAFDVGDVWSVDVIGTLDVGKGDWAVADQTFADVLFEALLGRASNVPIQGSSVVRSLDFPAGKSLTVLGDGL